jgi:IS30 family transposase
MQKYQRVALEDRIEIQAYLLAGITSSEIARILGFNKSTITREIKRNKTNRTYIALEAQSRAKESFKTCKRKYKIKDKLKIFTTKKLELGWSPEQIAGRLKHEKSNFSISHQSVYRFIKRENLDKQRLLRLGYKRRGFGRIIQQKHCRNSDWKSRIQDRPEQANNRTETGHWERDLFFGANRRTVLILSDRKTRYTLLTKTNNFKSDEVARLTKNLIKDLPVKTITNDNGSEFFDVKALSVPVYFCKALKPQQRGTVENTIGLLRQYIKRQTNLDQISDQKIKALEKRINMRPRKILDYKTPYEVFFNKTVALAM